VKRGNQYIFNPSEKMNSAKDFLELNLTAKTTRNHLRITSESSAGHLVAVLGGNTEAIGGQVVADKLQVAGRNADNDICIKKSKIIISFLAHITDLAIGSDKKQGSPTHCPTRS
jgi:hypothetical protein